MTLGLIALFWPIIQGAFTRVRDMNRLRST
jgi:hypothetical protein